jgi:imidazolonepropionase-like amidohydrolase
VRDQLRRQVDQIKLMVSGGISSPTDPLEKVQYSEAEIAVATEEAGRWGKYVMAHAYTPESITRAVEAGVRTIEHGNFIDEQSARRMADAQAYLVPTLVVYRKVVEFGEQLGLPEYHRQKGADVAARGTRSLEIAEWAGVKMAFGTDLFTMPDEHQNDEFLIRGEVLSPASVIRSATLIGAEVVGAVGRLGVIAKDALADLLVVDGNPLEDLSVLAKGGQHLSGIMKGGSFVKRTF